MLNIEQKNESFWRNVRDQFPALKQTVHGKPFIYLDSGATAQKPQSVINAVTEFYENDNANVHRGVYYLSQRATQAYEAVRDKVKHFIHAKNREEIIFTKGTTESINLVATCFGALNIKKDDEILLTEMEHHANIVPWQLLSERVGATIKVVPVLDDGSLDLMTYKKLINNKTKIIGLIHVSNVLGTINPIKEMIKVAQEKNIPVLIDGAQAIHHIPVDVTELNCDFYAFSAHKAYGPTGVGVLYAKEKWLNAMPPYQGGGDMIRSVSFEKTTYNDLPYKFEAGTPNIAGVIGLGAALDYLHFLNRDHIEHHEKALVKYAKQELKKVPGVKLIGDTDDQTAAVSFVLSQAHAHDVGTILDREGIAVRVGHHCAMPLMKRFHVAATVRASFGVYNNQNEVDCLCEALQKVIEIFR